jgi:hypothetical protein
MPASMLESLDRLMILPWGARRGSSRLVRCIGPAKHVVTQVIGSYEYKLYAVCPIRRLVGVVSSSSH